MSWTAFSVINDAEEVHTKLEIQGQDLDEAHEQFEYLKSIAANIIESGIAGEPPYNVSIGGHGNPDHKLTPNWANDFVSLNIGSVAEREE